MNKKNWKQWKKVSVMSNLQSNFHLKLDFQNMDQHTGEKWLIYGTKYHTENQL